MKTYTIEPGQKITEEQLFDEYIEELNAECGDDEEDDE